MIKSYKENWNELFKKNEISASNDKQYSKFSEKEWLKLSWSFGEDIFKEAENWIDLDKNSKILDLGCGSNGTFLIPAAKRGIRSVGVDISSYALKNLKKRIKLCHFKGKIELLELDITRRLPFKNDTFDAILGSSIMCNTKNLRKILSELNRITKVSGIIFLDSFLNLYHPNYFPYYIINKIKKKIDIDVIPGYYRVFSEVKNSFLINKLNIVRIVEKHTFLPFGQTFIYPTFVINLFNYINNKLLYSFPCRWSIYAKKIRD